MAAFDIAEAQEQLSALIDRALVGEEIMITRDGLEVVTLLPVKPAAIRVGSVPSQTDMDWLDEHRVGRTAPTMNAAELLRRMRDGEDER